MPSAALLDIDGTLIDTNYQHALAWFRAFRDNGHPIALWRLHRHIGMGGDHLVAAVAGDEVEAKDGDAVRDAEKGHYEELIGEVEPLRGARDLIDELGRRGHPVVLVSSAKGEELDHYLDLLDAREAVDGWTSSEDVDATKPAPDLVEAGMDKAGNREAVMVGDSTFDCEAAERAGIASVAVLTGGFSEQELRESGASEVYESISDLLESLDGSPLA